MPGRQRAEDFLRLELGGGWRASWQEKRKAFFASLLLHLVIISVMLVPFSLEIGVDEPPQSAAIRVRFYEAGGEGPGAGGGGGGSGGVKPTAYIRTYPQPKAEQEPPPPRRAPIAPRRIPPLRFDSLEVPDLPADTSMLFDHVYSPDATDYPGLSLTDGMDYGGLDTLASGGSGGGIGGGKGSGVGTGTGPGVGPGEGGGFGGGKYRPGGYDVEPVLKYKPPEPPYPPKARERMVTGEVILQILVKLDGSTEVVGVIKSIPYCVTAAKENAKLWRWKPALKDGQPVEVFGIITVKFDLFSAGRKS